MLPAQIASPERANLFKYYKERTAGKFYLHGRQCRCLGVGLSPEESGVSGAQVTVYLQTTATGALIGAGRRAAARDD
jgi:hypothetical protein